MLIIIYFYEYFAPAKALSSKNYYFYNYEKWITIFFELMHPVTWEYN